MPLYRPPGEKPDHSPAAQARRERHRYEALGDLIQTLEQLSADERGVSLEEYRAQKRRDMDALRDRADRDWAAWNRGEWGLTAPLPPAPPPSAAAPLPSTIPELPPAPMVPWRGSPPDAQTEPEDPSAS